MRIQPKFMTLSEFLNGRLFRIPPYQRAYSWERKQRRDLFDDIMALRRKGDATHFMATMVGLNRGKQPIATDLLDEIEVVDGQQRLTTLIILLKALSQGLNRRKPAEATLGKEIDSLLVKDGVSMLLLQTNHDSSNYFADYMLTAQHPLASNARTLADRQLLEAIEECETFVSSWMANENDLLALATILKNLLTLIFYELEDEGAVYTVFEVLNSRGIDVAWLDRLKSALMGIAFDSKGNKKDAINQLHQVWSDVYGCVGLKQGLRAEALKFAATLRYTEARSKVLGEQAAVDVLRDEARDSAKASIEVSRWILAVVKAVDALLADPRRAAVTKIAHARLLAVAIELRDDFGRRREKLLNIWEKVTFRIFGMCGKDARTRVGEYVRLARAIWVDRIDYEAALAGLLEIAGEEFDVDNAIESMRDRDCYGGWQEELRYFMFRYEEYLAKQHGQKFDHAQWVRIWEVSPEQSIEHICPQSAVDTGRATDQKTRSQSKIFVHQLGNLVLLPPRLNSKLGSSDPGKKAKAYGATGLFIAAELTGVVSKWNAQAVRKREEALLTWARTEWG